MYCYLVSYLWQFLYTWATHGYYGYVLLFGLCLRQKKAVLDPCVRATCALVKLQVTGRSGAEENGDIAGEYFLVGLHKGWPAYQQKGMKMCIRREKGRRLS